MIGQNNTDNFKVIGLISEKVAVIGENSKSIQNFQISEFALFFAIATLRLRGGIEKYFSGEHRKYSVLLIVLM